MERSGKTVFILAMIFSIAALVVYIAPSSTATSGYYGIPYWAEYSIINTDRAVSVPIWQITKNKSSETVCWQDYGPNPRFAIYDPNCNSNKNPSTWEDDVVLDKETGLEWERVPGYHNGPALGSDWFSAIHGCYTLFLAGRRGWRLPKAEELLSLVDPSQTFPALTECNPFPKLTGDYWTATTDPYEPTFAFVVEIDHGTLPSSVKTSTSRLSWCVRGGQGADFF